MTQNKVVVSATSSGFPKRPCLLETETLGPWKGADSRALFEPPDFYVGVSK